MILILQSMNDREIVSLSINLQLDQTLKLILIHWLWKLKDDRDLNTSDSVI